MRRARLFLVLVLLPWLLGFGGVSVGLLSSPAIGGYATPAVVQSNSAYNSGSSVSPATLSSSATAGNVLVLWVSGLSSVTSTSVSGGGVSSWSSIELSCAGASTYGKLFYGVTTGGSVSITISNEPSDPGYSLVELSGINTTSPVHANTSSGCTRTAIGGGFTSASVNTTVPTLLLGIVASGITPLSSWGSGWTQVTAQSSHYHGTAYRVASSSGSYSLTGVAGVSDVDLDVHVVAFGAAPL